ncbi:MAG: hypothetical protein JNK38_20585 [Acidobacteria bacterium]|nr:hypothetical protein [Acidobacteriota bacterium]
MKPLARTFALCICIVFVVSSTAKPLAQQARIPNLDNLKDYPDVGQKCPLRGNAPAGQEKAKSNALKNRYKLPPGGFTPMLLSDIFSLPLGPGGEAPLSGDPNNAKAVSVVGFVHAVEKGGSRGESCNCKATGGNQVDTHIELILDPNNPSSKGRKMVVVEVTERGRRLAISKFLQTNIGNNWTTSMLKSRLLGRWVRFSGWLFYDPDHHLETWQSDPDDSRGKANWRETGWEIHPVMAIEVNVTPPPDRIQ